MLDHTDGIRRITTKADKLVRLMSLAGGGYLSPGRAPPAGSVLVTDPFATTTPSFPSTVCDRLPLASSGHAA